ncbi:MAG: glutathione S-transferase family protein [Lysobacterales bacterium]
MPQITLYELGPTRSARCRWTLLEAGLPYESAGNDPKILGSDELRRLHPLGKLPVAVIDGRPLFESAAIAAAIADLVPEQQLIAPPGSWQRSLHDQWVLFALTELEPWVWTAELNTLDFVFPVDQHVPAIIPQCRGLYRKSAAVLDRHFEQHEHLIDGRFSVADIILGYTLNFGDEFDWNAGFPALQAYLERLFEREHCTLVRNLRPDQ